MGDRPALGDIEGKERGELFGGLAGNGVAPGAKFRELFPVPIKGQVTVHHRGHADGADGGQLHAAFCLHIGFEP